MIAFTDDESDDLYDRSSFDKVIDLRRVFGPRPVGRQPANPPAIGVGEITSSARRDVGALEVIARLRQQRRRGGPAGLAWYTPTGLVRYAVVNPDQSRILWQGNLGRIPGLAAMSASQREAAVRQLITQRTGQRFRNLQPGHKGPDLVPAFDAMQGGFPNGPSYPGRGARRDERTFLA